MRIPPSTLALLLAVLPCSAQQSSSTSAPNSDQSQSSSQSQNGQSQSQAQSQPQGQSPDKSQATDKSQPPAAERKRLPLGKQPTTADENPFPEDISKKAAASAGSSTPDAPAARPDKPPASPDGSQPDYSSSRTGLQNLDADSRESRISNGAGGFIHDPKLATQDVKVGGFYLNAGDYKGAYARFKEATEVNPENADAVFGLAEAARGLKLKDEAADNYRIYLDAFPDGPKSRAARKALAELAAAPKK